MTYSLECVFFFALIEPFLSTFGSLNRRFHYIYYDSSGLLNPCNKCFFPGKLNKPDAIKAFSTIALAIEDDLVIDYTSIKRLLPQIELLIIHKAVLVEDISG